MWTWVKGRHSALRKQKMLATFIWHYFFVKRDSLYIVAAKNYLNVKSQNIIIV